MEVDSTIHANMHTKTSRDARGAMADTKSIINALISFGETSKARGLPYCVHPCPPTRQYLMWVGLIKKSFVLQLRGELNHL